MRLIGPCTMFLISVAISGGNVAAQSVDQHLDEAKGSGQITGVPFEGGRVQGDTIEDPFFITEIPAYETGNTCGFTLNYDEMCPYGGNAPDVVYEFFNEYERVVHIDLCESLYDTKVYVYDFEGGYGFGNPWACNDDSDCGPYVYRSELLVELLPWTTYHIVVDGYGSSCGEYILQINEYIVEEPECPAGALMEGEPDCYDDYIDGYNAGCSGIPDPVFQPLEGTPNGERFDLCGTSGTYLVYGMEYRDTDWYQLEVQEESTITFECYADFPVQILTLYGSEGCQGMYIIESDQAPGFPDVASITHTYEPGIYWFWVGPYVFSGVDCGSLYVMSITGYEGQGPTPVVPATWGRVKGRFRP